MIVIIVLSIIALITWALAECFILTEEGTPAKDSDILEMLEKYKVEYNVEKKWNDKFKLRAPYSRAPSIHQTKNSIIFPYYISNVGVVPIWYKGIIRGLYYRCIPLF
jgi:hypothetical protein